MKKKSLLHKFRRFKPFTELKYKVLDFIAYIQRVYAYAKFLKTIRDYDWSYAVDVFVFQLKRLESRIATGHHADRDKTARQIRATINTLAKVQEDYFYHKQHDILDKKYGQLIMKSKKIKGEPLYTLDFTPKKCLKNPELLKQYKKEFTRRLKLSQKYDEQAIQRLGKMFHRNLRKWWV